MRDIKFRIYDKEQKKMFSHAELVKIAVGINVNLANSIILPLGRKDVELMQYTGLKDKNGKEIYEGDIVTTDINRPYLIVEFRDGCFMFNCNDGHNDYYDIMLPILEEPQTTYKYGEVIGNVYENKDLLR